MKKSLFVLLTLFVVAQAAMAVPALRGKYKYTQPDGSVIILETHGDEYYHWTTDASGRTVQLDARGFYVPVSVSETEHRSRYRAAREKVPKRAWSTYDNPPVTNFGDRKILCLLAEFAPTYDSDGTTVLFDGKYVLDNPKQHFTEMLNQNGYSQNGAIGSVRDYYIDNSMQQYRPEFDVYGPVTLEQSSQYYDDNGVHLAILEAYRKLSSEIDISKYDTDNNGTVDMVLFYYPGCNEAEHAPAWTIWPHQSTGNFGWMGRKTFNRYFCTSELSGRDMAEAVPASIGTTCHEFAHSLGLPDFYDVGDEAEGGKNSIYDCTSVYDVMCYGNYNDGGRKPPYLTSLERNMLGWMPAPPVVSSSGNYTLNGVQENTAYRIDSQVEGEFFLLECRNREGWDRGTPASGMVVFHVDQSSRRIANGVSAASLWSSSNKINAYGGHPCYAIVASCPLGNEIDLVFPGRGVPDYEPVDWEGNSVGISLTGIVFSGGEVSFDANQSGVKSLYGYVKDVYGEPLADATVILSRAAYASEAPPLLSTDRTCTTNERGYYSFTLEDTDSQYQVVKAAADGYVSLAYNVAVTGSATRQDFVLMLQGQDPPATLKKYDESLTMYGGGLGQGSIAVGMCYTAAELSTMGAVGATVSEVSFLSSPDEGSSVYLVIDIGSERVLRKEVTSQYRSGDFMSFDISDESIVIPEGQNVFIGYGLTNISDGTYPFKMYGPMTSSDGGNYYLYNFLSSSNWRPVQFSGGTFDFVVSAVLSRTAAIDFASYGVSYIKPVDGVPQVVPAAGKSVHAITWYLDGTELSEGPGAVSDLPAGAHTYMARISHYDGTVERVYYDVNKE